ncbi:MAG: amidohydrolase family protein [Candidatus Omnitrophica bacterium]|nr:amidohydrolase family protein [Candidatus Omnitrophota bacterium]
MSEIIDVHSHYMPPEVAEHTAFFKVNWSDLDRQLKAMDGNGIAKSVLLYPTSDAHFNMDGWANVSKIYNACIAAVVKKHPSRFIGAGILPGDQPDAIGEELKHIEDLNLRVLSLASSYNGVYLDDERFFLVYEWALKNDIIIHIHPQIINPIGEERLKDPLLSPVLEYVFDVSVCLGRMMMNETFLKYPDVKFIFAHYGGVLPIVKERFDNTYTMLRQRNFVKDLTKLPGEFFKNLYFDTSGSKSTASLMCALEVADAKHILFGSDYPANQALAGSIEMIINAGIADFQKEDILNSALFNGASGV